MNWFTADTHFGHAKIIEYANRPFCDVEQMNEELIRRWNECVLPEDTIYHLGDFALGPHQKQKSIIARLQGRKVLIQGSHDYDLAFLVDCGFVEAHPWLILPMGGVPVYLIHEPPPALEGLPRGTRYCLHGHTHRLPSKLPFLNVGVDQFGFRPISEEALTRLLR